MASNVIGHLSAILSLNSKSFTRGTRNASRLSNQMANSITKSIGGMALRVGGLLAGVAGVAGFGLLIKSSLKTMDAVGKLADRLGDSTEALSGIGFAAQLSGVSTESFQRSLGFLSKTLGEAVQRGGPAADVVKRLGLNLDDLAAMAPTDALKVIADKINLLGTASEKNAAIVALFGRSGMELGNLLRAGSVGIEAMEEQARKLGITFSREAAAKAELANDAMLRMKQIAIGLGQTVAIELSPFITAMADNFTNAASSGEGMGARVSLAFERIARAVAFAADVFQFFVGVIKFVQGVLGVLLTVVVAGATGLVTLADAVLGLFGVNTLNTITTFMEQLTSELAVETKAAFTGAGEAFGKSFDGAASKAVEAAIAEAQRKAEEGAAKIAAAGKVNAGVGTLAPDAGAASVGQAGFSQISRAFSTLGGAPSTRNRVIMVGDPEQTSLLQQIRDRLWQGVPAVAN